MLLLLLRRRRHRVVGQGHLHRIGSGQLRESGWSPCHLGEDGCRLWRLVLQPPLQPRGHLGIVLVPLELQLVVIVLSQEPERLQVSVRQPRHRIHVFGRQASDWTDLLLRLAKFPLREGVSKGVVVREGEKSSLLLPVRRLLLRL